MKSIEEKISFAIKLLQSIPSEEIELCFSGGKDSSVILELAKMAGIKYRAIYKATTIDPKGTIRFCRENGCEIIRPNKTFFDLIKERGFPTRRCRFCCDVLKEYKVLEHAIIGIRVSESRAREKNYKEPQICRIYGNGGRKKKDRSNVVCVYLPILDWTDSDVEQFINERNIQCHPLYYDEQGKFIVERRLGCIACPLISKGRQLEDFKRNPKFVKLYIKNGLEWWNKPRQKEIASKTKFESIYDLFVHNIFFSSYENFMIFKNGFLDDRDCKKMLEDYFKINL
jgi:phosphoadenosine phosphosulfate reductase